jgi:hypothetical protein
VNKPTGPTITVRSPEAGGEEKVYPLAAERVTVGRSVPGHEPDIALGPDPQSWISRLHCWFERVDGAWTVVDNGSVNGTVVERRGKRQVVDGRLRLDDGDEVLILGYLVDDEPYWWRLCLVDPFATARGPAPTAPAQAPYIDYQLAEARLVVVDGERRTEIPRLGRNRHKLIRYMASRNAANSGTPVTCNHDELIAAVWGEPDSWDRSKVYTADNLRDLVFELRKRLRPHDDLIETIPGLGYLLHTRAR